MSSSNRIRDSQEFKVPPKFKFQEGEKVLCFHGPLIYEAKCLQSRFDEKEKVVQYHIHYSGWNKSWDEWVPETRVLKYNDNNLQKQKELHKAQKTEPKSKKGKKRSISGKESESKDKDTTDSRSSTPVTDKNVGKASASATLSSSQESASDVPKRKRTKTDPTVESEEQFLTKVEIKVKIPDELKPILVDDWQNICVQKKLLKFPLRITADGILEEYLAQKVSSKNAMPNKENARTDMVSGIRSYFNVMLGPQLLYECERKQYTELMREKGTNMKPSSVYGAVHLLRLFVRIGRALAYSRLDEKHVQCLLLHLQDFLKHLQKNVSTYFSIQDYIADPSAEGQRT
uniref:Putative dosage compensation regulatory complex/histone acetyltransferase complex n=1 Tax=Panstrongylus megistus TaxID=65343 RepID=A0A069DT38_9HEMI